MWSSPCLLCLDNSYSSFRSRLRKVTGSGKSGSPCVNTRLDPPVLYIPSWLLIYFVVSGGFPLEADPKRRMQRQVALSRKWSQETLAWQRRGETGKGKSQSRVYMQLNMDKWRSVPLGTSGHQHRVRLSLEVWKARKLLSLAGVDSPVVHFPELPACSMKSCWRKPQALLRVLVVWRVGFRGIWARHQHAYHILQCKQHKS